MIELKIDRDRITELAPLRLETVLFGDTGPVSIVAPREEAFRKIAEEAQADLRQRTDAEAPLLDEEEFAGANGLPGNVIAVGHGANNRLLRRLMDLRHLNDEDFPSPGLRLVSIHNPFGDGWNVLAAAGYTPEAARAGVRKLVDCVTEREGRWLTEGRLYEKDPVPDTPDPEAFLAEGLAYQRANIHGRPSHFLEALEYLNATGDPRWARTFMGLVSLYATGELPLTFVLLSAVDFWTDRLVEGWDAAEEFAFFSDEERLLMANFIASCGEYCHDSLTYLKWHITDDDLEVYNHHTFPATGLYFAVRYLRTHGYMAPLLDAWHAKALRVFERAARAGRSFDEGPGVYSWLVGVHLIKVALAEGDTSYLRSEKLSRYADLAVITTNNRFESVAFGDCAANHIFERGAATILLRAAEWRGDAGYKWVAQQGAPEAAASEVLTRGLPSAPPERHVGLFVLPMDPTILRWSGRPVFPGYPPPHRRPNLPAEETFDKISLRGAWDRDADYLLLQGFGAGGHGHPDANAVSQYQSKGRLWLFDGDFIRRAPWNHNMVMVIRDGEHGPIPVSARLDAAEEFPGGAVTRTTLPDYSGCDWTRTLVWLRGDCVLVIDTLKAKIAGDYDVRCYWQTPGEVVQTERGMVADHEGERFHVIEATDSERRVTLTPPPLDVVEYPEYRFGANRPWTLCERRQVELSEGEGTCFVNLLLPNGESETPRRRVARDADGAVRVTGAGPTLTVTSEGLRLEGEGHDTSMRVEGLTTLDSSGARGATPATRRCAESAREEWRIRLSAPAASAGPAECGGAVFGCEDGVIGAVDAAGEVRQLARTDARVGAVLAARLYGRERLTCLAAGDDETLRFLAPDGTEDLSLKLPRNSHMPARGRALCVADLDGDGRLWPVVGTAAWRAHAVAPDGSFRWTFATAAHGVTALAAGDLNGDGRQETAVATIYPCVPAITTDGDRLWHDEDYNDYWQAGPHFHFIQIADVDGDGKREVIAVASDTLIHCISNEGKRKWSRSIGDDPAGLEITPRGIAAVSVAGDAHMVDGTGNRVWRVKLGARCNALARAASDLCVALDTGELLWLDMEGRIRRRYELPAPAHHLVGFEDGAAIAASVDGSLTRLSPR